MDPSKWLIKNRPVEQTTWAPGLPLYIPDRLCTGGGWIDRKDVTSFNQYREPRIKLGDATKANPWLAHIRRIYPDDASHIINWLAHRVQRPQEKLNHGLVLGGSQGIGKDTLLEPAKHAVGPWNFHDVTPSQMVDTPFNGYAKAVILRVNEGRDLGEADRFKFYDHLKSYAAAPPDVLRVNEKHLREFYIPNCVGLIITTNYKTDGIYLPVDDRRHYIAWSNCTKEDFTPAYWDKLWGWYDKGGFEHVAAYLNGLDISPFDPKAPPPKTAAFWDIISANTAPEDAELADVIDELKNPDTLTLSQLIVGAKGNITDWLMDRRNRRALPHRLERCGYAPVKNPTAKDGLWKLKDGGRQVIYGKTSLTPEERWEAAQKFYEANR